MKGFAWARRQIKRIGDRCCTLPVKNGDGLAERITVHFTSTFAPPWPCYRGHARYAQLAGRGLPNNSPGDSHPLLKKHQGYLFQRALARSTPCGETPNPATPFAKLPDVNRSGMTKATNYQSSSFTYQDPSRMANGFINAEMVPEPIDAKLAGFDASRVGNWTRWQTDRWWGKFNLDKNRKTTIPMTTI